jgi:hypothetical protein
MHSRVENLLADVLYLWHIPISLREPPILWLQQTVTSRNYFPHFKVEESGRPTRQGKPIKQILFNSPGNLIFKSEVCKS